MRVLSNHGLVEVATSSEEWIESKGYNIHSCVHSWTVHSLNQKWDSDLARLAVKFVGAHVPEEKDIRPWLIQRRLLQHVARCSYIVLHGLITDDSISWAFHQMGLLCADQGKLVEAEQMYTRALQGYEKAWGPEHTSTLDTVNNLGLLYADQGKLVEAEQMYTRALQGYEKALGTDNIITYVPALNTIWSFGSLFECQANIAKARTMYSKALLGYKQVYGPEHAKSETLRDKLYALDVVAENKVPVEIKERADDPQVGPSHLGIRKVPSISKRHRLFRKLGLK